MTALLSDIYDIGTLNDITKHFCRTIDTKKNVHRQFFTQKLVMFINITLKKKVY